MKNFIICLGIASSVLLSGCAAVVQGGAMMMGKNEADHPATKNFVVAMEKNDAFNASLRALTAKGRKVISSDREAGVVNGEINENAVTIKITRKGNKESTIDITVAYVKAYSYGGSKLNDDLNTLVAEINNSINTSASTISETYKAPEALVKKQKNKRKSPPKSSVL